MERCEVNSLAESMHKGTITRLMWDERGRQGKRGKERKRKTKDRKKKEGEERKENGGSRKEREREIEREDPSAKSSQGVLLSLGYGPPRGRAATSMPSTYHLKPGKFHA